MLVQPLRSPDLRQVPSAAPAAEPKVAVLLNANARKVDARVVKTLSHIVPEQDLFLSRSPLDARRIIQTVLERGYPMVFAGGGDGTFMGFVNEVHEPPFYFGTNRPFVERVILPSTWRENGAGLFGRVGERMSYRVYVVNGFDATGFSSAGLRGGRGVPLFRILPHSAAGHRIYGAEVLYGGARYFAGPAISRSCGAPAETGECQDNAEQGDRSSSVLSLIAEILALNQSPDAIRAPSRLIAE